jgi:type II secretory pathway predicted ATPase ExeA
MYKTFFKLARNPFDLTPDPVCFVPTDRHNEALAALYHGVRQHKGFVVLTGEVGTGKTLLLRCLLGLLKESKDIAYAYLFNGRLSPTEFLQYILADFGLPAAGKSKFELLLDLGHFLASRGAMKMTTVLIVDEAHHLSAEILEEVRLLSNLETTNDKLLQIVLVGQPELDDKLDSVGLRQLKQRIAVRTQLAALNGDETRRYIERRLQIAGHDPLSTPLFPEETMVAVHRYSRGLPRLINTICENALMAAYAKRLPCVTLEIVDDVAREFRLDFVSALDGEKARRQNTADAQRALNVLLDLFAALGNSTVDAEAGRPVAVEMSKHEPYI